MLRRYTSGAILFALFFLLSNTSFAQSTDRAGLEGEITALREQLKQKEQEFLSPSEEDRAAFAEFLSQPGTGLIRLLPREKYEQKVTTQGGGAFYSFSRLTHEYGSGSDILLEANKFRVGFAGANFGFLAQLGDVPLERVTTETKGVEFLAALAIPAREPDARVQQQHANTGLKNGEFTYQNYLPVQVGQTYVVRSVNYYEADTLVAFRVVRQDTDGSVILLWKRLKKFSKPELTN